MGNSVTLRLSGLSGLSLRKGKKRRRGTSTARSLSPDFFAAWLRLAPVSTMMICDDEIKESYNQNSFLPSGVALNVTGFFDGVDERDEDLWCSLDTTAMVKKEIQ